MEWQTILSGAIGGSPLAVVLAFASYKLWSKCEEKDKTIAAKDAEIAALNEKRVSDLKAIAKQND